MEWLTTKKRGRDDDQITLDKQRALEHRRSKKKINSSASISKKNKNSSSKLSFKTKSKRPKARRKNDDDGSTDSFIDDDDFEEDEDEEEQSFHEEDELSDDENSFDSAEEIKEQHVSGDSDDDHGTFLPIKGEKRISKPAPVFKKIFEKSTKPAAFVKPKLLIKKPTTKENLTPSLSNVAGKTTIHNLQQKKSVRPIVSNTSSVSSKISLKPEQQTIVLSDDSSFASASALFRENSRNGLPSGRRAIDNDTSKNQKLKSPTGQPSIDDLADTPVNSKNVPIKRNFKKLRKRIVDDDDDEDVQIVTNPFQRYRAQNHSSPTNASDAARTTSVFKNATFSVDDYCSDEDEAIALAMALEQSKASVTTTSRKMSSKPKYKVEEEKLELRYADDDDDDDAKVEYDEDTEVAMSVLKTANSLRAEVLQKMMRWLKRHSALTNENVDESGIPIGMIVDGAMAMSSIGEVDSSISVDSESPWISRETMQEILPNANLADYQLIGVNWMWLLHDMKCQLGDGPLNGKRQKSDKPPVPTNVNGVLADEMGLGKTVQTIAFLSWLKHINTSQKICTEVSLSEFQPGASRTKHATALKPHLIVSPASVVANWEREFQKFAPQLHVVKYYGSMEERAEIQQHLRDCLQTCGAQNGKHVDVVLCPVTYFEKERGDDRSFLRSFQYEYLVVDEAHLLKNARGNRYKQLHKVKSNHRLLLTGTPVQNSPKELMALLCFLMPLFGKSKSNGFEEDSGFDGGESMLQHFVSIEAKQDGIHDNQAAYVKLKQLFSPFVLRRRKEDVLSQILPPKERRVEFLQLDPHAKKLYDTILAEHVEAKKTNAKLSFEHLFTELRKAAHHPLLIRTRFKEPLEREKLAKDFLRYGAFRGDACNLKKVSEELKSYSDFEIHLTAHSLVAEDPQRRSELGQYLLNEDDLFCSAKFARLRVLLPDLVSKGHRILIFSGWTTLLDLLTCLMDSLNLSYMRMDGQTDVGERQDRIDRFNRDSSIPVFLLSTRASGLGITLTSAQVCIMHDLDFNPFTDLQAEDRCHRIGQTKKVTVIKLVTEGTVDEDVYAMQERKAKMNSAIMNSEAEWKRESKNERDVIIKTAVNRYLTQHEKIDAEVPSSSVADDVTPRGEVVCRPSGGQTNHKFYDTIDSDLV